MYKDLSQNRDASVPRPEDIEASTGLGTGPKKSCALEPLHGVKRIACAVISRSMGEVLLLAALAALAPLAVYIDDVVLGNDLSESSITEVMQNILILFSTVVFWIEAWRQPHSRGFFVLVGGCFACMFLHDLDFAFNMIQQGYWFVPIFLTALATMVFASLWGETVFVPMTVYTNTRSCTYVSIGLLIAMLFSEAFGSDQVIWLDIMGVDYSAECKDMIQEGMKLFGYVFICYGSCLLPKTRQSKKNA
jgi:hypothetical protein